MCRFNAVPALVFGLVLASLAPSAVAATRTWPGAAPCAGTLQACIDNSGDGDRIEIATNTPIAEDISIYDKNRTLTAAAGYHPIFGPFHWLSITSSGIAGDRNVSASKLAFNDGYVLAIYNGVGTATYDLRDLVLTHNVLDAQNFIEVDANGGTLNAMVYNNRLTGVPRSASQGIIHLAARGGTLNANAYYNHVRSTHSGSAILGSGILADYAGSGSGGAVKLHGNEVRGGFNQGGIAVSEGRSSAPATSFNASAYSNVIVGAGDDASYGMNFTVYNGTLSAQAIANTITRCSTGIFASDWVAGTTSGHISGVVSSNLIRGPFGLYFYSPVTTSLNNDYNLLDVSGNTATLGVHTIAADARLVSDDVPRLRPGSPAIDAGDTATVALGIVFNTLPVTDADGLRRITGAADKVDIGAYESGNTSFVHTATAANISSYITHIDNTATNGIADADPFITPHFNNVAQSQALGVYACDSGDWCIFGEDAITPMQANAQINVLAAAAGSGRVRHQATVSNTSGAVTTIDASGLNSLPDRVALVTQNWSIAGIYNLHQVALAYDATAASGSGRWTVVNGGSAAMPANAGFNVYFQEPSPNAFRLVASADNLSTGQLAIRHPLLDNVACASVHVSRVFTPGSSPIGAFDVFYGTDHLWRIYSYATGVVVAGDAYDVVVDPAQVSSCSDLIFANGLD